jgi:signal transduction histidine kinase
VLLRRRPDELRNGVWRSVAGFSIAGVLAVVAVGFGLVVASRRVGEREAIASARAQTVQVAREIVEPSITNGLSSGDPTVVLAIDDLVRRFIISEDLVRVKVWRADGRIMYANDPRLMGETFAIEDDELAVLETGSVAAGVSNLSDPENRYELANRKLLEVYVRVQQPDGTAFLFETYYRFDVVTQNGNKLIRDFAPVSLGALAALQLVQIPLAWSLARRLRERQREREGLLESALDASSAERRRIASDLHDGVVQDLAGVALILSGAALQPGMSQSALVALEDSASEVRETIGSLRTLLVEIYPPNLFEEGLESALDDLASRAGNRGVEVEVTALDANQLPKTPTALIYRAAQEGLRNVVSHSRAKNAWVTLAQTSTSAVLEVRDNGVGFDDSRLDTAFAEGHLGIRALSGLASDAGGTLKVSSMPAGGTCLRLEVPLR